jgi:hypothetical protein
MQVLFFRAEIEGVTVLAGVSVGLADLGGG